MNCNDSNKIDEDDSISEITVIQKSSKQGISFSLTHPEDLKVLKSSVSWWYNWQWKTDDPKIIILFIKWSSFPCYEEQIPVYL